eukprot:106366-Pyramimonas_sp.AAC.1
MDFAAVCRSYRARCFRATAPPRWPLPCKLHVNASPCALPTPFVTESTTADLPRASPFGVILLE